MKNVILIDEANCLFCRTCEAVCSTAKEGEVSLAKSRIHVVPDHEKRTSKPSACRHCGRPPCAKACPVDAIVKNEKTKLVELNKDECIGCGECVEACPFGAIVMIEDFPEWCDLCGGDPLCVKFCPHEALAFGSISA